ncbi:MAG TPA: hypothetical protein ENH23_04350 [candidate division Zixibacteria bacterium]|nr:hypothetical protein [candidate division Zixibacteria bacterium]
MIFIIIYAVQINNGIAKEVVGPAYNLRIEIINAGAENGLEEQLGSYLKKLELADMQLDIIKTSRFTLQPSKETFLISRTKDNGGVRELAKLLDIDIEKIQYSELKHNKAHLNATIVIGKDSVIDALLNKPKELE